MVSSLVGRMVATSQQLATKVGVVIFVIIVGWRYVNPDNWTTIDPAKRRTITVGEYLDRNPDVAKLIPSEKHREFTNGEQQVRFVFKPAAYQVTLAATDTVYVAGSFNGWSKAG